MFRPLHWVKGRGSHKWIGIISKEMLFKAKLVVSKKEKIVQYHTDKTEQLSPSYWGGLNQDLLVTLEALRSQPREDTLIWNHGHSGLRGLSSTSRVLSQSAIFVRGSVVWPQGFQISPPTDDYIALYFFPEYEGDRKVYDSLLADMTDQDLALKAMIRAGPGVSPARHWAGATPSIGQPQGKKKLDLVLVSLLLLSLCYYGFLND
uniref:AIPP2-like SPOC-like domain-containing protein n=1 Tax=Fagus sylvatica TaxID=28930 RepID=A0A2N9GAV4_FAGSY